MKYIVPAILTNDKEDLEKKLKQVSDFSEWVQVDIMDGQFVDNVSVSLEDLNEVVQEDVKLQVLKVEVHLMTRSPQNYFDQCEEFGFSRVTFHFEACDNLAELVDSFEEYSFEKFLAISPQTKIDDVKDYLIYFDGVLLLSVTPGFQGQTFQKQVVGKVQEIREINASIKIGIDGGVNLDTVLEIANSNVDYAVVGGGIFFAGNLKENYNLLKQKIN